MVPGLHSDLAALVLIPYGHCCLWQPGLVWPHVLSDGVAALAYFSMFLALLDVARHRRDLASAWFFQLLGALIVASGLAHFIEIWILWHPTYWLLGGLKALTAILALIMAAVLISVIPRLLTLPSWGELEAVKADLEQQSSDFQMLSTRAHQYRCLLDSIEAIVWELDALAFKFTFVNRKAEVILGYPSEQWLTEPDFWQNHIHPEDREWVIDLCRRMTQALQNHEMEYRMVAADGRVVWLWDQVEVVAAGDRPVKLQGIMIDISDRKAIEEALERSNTRLRNLAANIPGAVFRYVLRADGSDAVLYISPGCYELWEVEASIVEADATILWHMIHPDDRAATSESVLESARTLQPWSWAWRITTPSGREKWLEAAGRPERQENGDVIWDTVILDVTTRKQTEIALAESQQHHQNLVENSPDVIERFDLQLRHLYISPAFTQVTGIPAEGCLGKTCRELGLDETMVSTWENAAAAVIRTGQKQVIEFSTPTLQGVRFFEMAIAPERAKDQTIQAILCISRDITERKQAAATLQASEERLRLALAAADQGLYDLNIQTGEAIVSPEYALMLGYDPATFEETNARWIERLHPDDRAPVVATYRAYIAGALPEYRVEFRQRTQSGDYKWILSLGKIVTWDEDGRPLRMLGTHTDITERKQAAAELQASEERLRLALEAAKQGMYDIDLKAGTAVLSPEYIEMLGYTPDEFDYTATGWRDRLHPDEQQAVFQTFLDYTQGKRVDYQVEFRQRTKTGDYKWILSLARIVAWDEDGRPLRMIGTHTDITERKQAETQLRDLTDRLGLAVQAAKMGIWDWDIASDRLTWDERMYELYGLQPSQQAIGYEIWEKSIHPDDLAMCRMVLQQALAGEIDYNAEFRILWPDGSIHYIEAHAIVQRDSHGHPLRMIGVNLDVSDRKQTEIALRFSEARLRAFMDNSPASTWVTNPANGRIEYANQNYHRTLAVPQTVVGKTLAELFPPDIAATYLKNTRQVAATGQILETIEPGIRFDQSIGDFLVLKFPLPQADGSLWVGGVAIDITDRKRAEEAQLQAEKLRLELNLLERILNSVLAGYWDWDIPNQRSYMSSGLKRMFGYEDHELPDVPETWQSLIYAEDLPGVMECFEHHVQTRGQVPYYNEVRYHHKNGSTVWVICAGQVIEWDETGQPLRMVGCHVDITKQKQTEAQLQTNERHLKQAQRIGKLGSWEFELATETITWSDEVFHLFGLDPAIGPPKSFDDLQQLIDPRDRAFHAQTVQTLIETRQPYDIECRICRADGTVGWIQARGEVVLDTAEQVTQLTGIVLDITERKQIETQLESLSDRLKLALQAGEIGVWEWDLNNEVYWDERIYEIYGLQHLGRPATYQDWTKRLDPEDLKRVEAAQQAAIHDGQDFKVEFQIKRTDGEVRWAKAEAIVQRNHKGEAIRMIGINFDITERKRAEAKILQTTAQLQASNRELEAFAYSVSHDLRAPLRAIDGFSKALLEDYGDRFDAEGKDYFARIRHNVHRMGLLIDDLLRLSRVSRSEMRYTTVNLSALVQDQVKELQASDPKRQVEFRVAPGAIVSADPTLMRVVITNLLENAWKFTSHHSSAQIEFGIIRSEEQPVYFVRDDGAGFDMTYASKLFGVFQRLHSMDEFPGTGIGLATVQRAILRHGGQVWAQGAIEQGATIYFTIPNLSLGDLHVNDRA